MHCTWRPAARTSRRDVDTNPAEYSNRTQHICTARPAPHHNDANSAASPVCARSYQRLALWRLAHGVGVLLELLALLGHKPRNSNGARLLANMPAGCKFLSPAALLQCSAAAIYRPPRSLVAVCMAQIYGLQCTPIPL